MGTLRRSHTSRPLDDWSWCCEMYVTSTFSPLRGEGGRRPDEGERSPGATRSHRHPVPLQIQPPPHIKLDPLGFEQHPLQLVRVAGSPRADLASRIHDAMPRHVAPFRKVVQRVSDLSCVARQAGRLGDIAVGRDPSSWQFRHRRPDPLVAFHRKGIVRCTVPGASLLTPDEPEVPGCGAPLNVCGEV
jgi:hypothetical protein